MRPKLVAIAGILEKPPRRLVLVLVNQDAPGKNPDRAFHHAHVLIDNHMPDMRALEQRFDRRNQNGIIGADKLAQSALPFAA